MTLQEKFGQRVKELRLAKNLSQEKLARKSSIKRDIIDQAENGHKHISVETLNKILNALGISLRDFIGDEVFKNWITESSWKAYFYLNMCTSVYLYCDQPTTCPLCGCRADLIFEYDVLLRYASVNQCFDKKCRYIFMMESDWKEMQEAIAIIRGKWKNRLSLENRI